jgi:hypothetical protein
MTQITYDLEKLIKQSLENFYERRIAKLSGLKLRQALQKKNPYLFRAIGLEKASELVERLLDDYMSSSDETIFGDAFFEPIAKICSGGVVAPSEGVDVAIETDSAYKAISVKSGPNIFNASQAKRMDDEFLSLQRRIYKLQKKFDPVLGHGYGKKVSLPTKNRHYRVVSGQVLWEELTGDSGFYLKLIDLMCDYPRQHRIEFEKEWDKAVNRFERDILNEFAKPDGSIDWKKLTEFNSGAREATLTKEEVMEAIDKTGNHNPEELQKELLKKREKASLLKIKRFVKEIRNK